MKILNVLLSCSVVTIFTLKVLGSPLYNPTEEDGKLEEPQNKIVGGIPVNIEQFPYQVSLQYNGRHFCGGSIIKPNFILTAAHCIRDIGNSSITIRAGSSYSESGGVSIPVVELTSHPQYAKETPQDFDVAMLRLKTNLKYNKQIRNVRLPRISEPKAGNSGTITGWGILAESGGIPKQLMATNIIVVNRQTCVKQYEPKKYNVTSRMICATAPNRDSCYGDSGGPFAFNGTIIGITSWGYGCNRTGYSSVYTNIGLRDILKWIYQIISGS